MTAHRPRPRTERSAGRAGEILAFCRQPRTMAQIVAHCADGDAERTRFSVYNLRKRGLLTNTVPTEDAWGRPVRCQRGMFVVADGAARELAADDNDRFDASALVAAWHPQAAAHLLNRRTTR